MVKKYVFGNPMETEAVVEPIEQAKGEIEIGQVDEKTGFSFTYQMDDTDVR